MKILVDSREQRNGHILQVFSEKEIQFKVKGLKFGDYSFEVDGRTYENEIILEKKNSLSELAGSFTSGRRRFKAEFERAKASGAKIILLIEDEKARDKLTLRKQYDKYIKKIFNEFTWIENTEFPELTLEKALNKTWKSFFTGASMVESLRSWIDKYEIEVVLCDRKRSGEEIVNIFQKYIDAKL